MSRPLNFNKVTREWVGANYKPYGKNPKDGCDCFSIAVDLLRKYNADLPNEFDGITENTYYEFWLKNPAKALLKFVDFLESTCKEIKPQIRKAGDFLFLYHTKTGDKTIGIYGGNNKVVLVNDEVGVTVIGLKDFKVLRAFRGYYENL
jgi:hypothetical protein